MKVYNALGQLASTQYDGVIQNAKRSMFLSLVGGWSSITNPDGGTTFLPETAGKQNFRGCMFSGTASTDIFHEFSVAMPDNWDLGTITARPYFVTNDAETTGTIIFGLQGWAYGDGDTLTQTWTATSTAAQLSTTTLSVSALGLMRKGATTGAITIGGTPAKGDLVQFRTYRLQTDTCLDNVILLGWYITYGTNNYSDV